MPSKGVHQIVIGRPNQQPPAPKFFTQAAQAVDRGGGGNNFQCTHQTTGESIPECLERLAGQVRETHQLKREGSGIVRLPNGRG